MSLVDCVNAPDICGKSTECVTRAVWNEMSSLLIGFMEKITLEDLVKKYKKKKESCNGSTDYTI